MYMTKPSIDFEKKHIIPFRNMLDIPQLEKLHDGEKDVEIKRFEYNGLPVIFYNERNIYESPDQDTVIISYEETMLPEEDFDVLVNKVKPKNKKSSKSEKKQEKGKRKSKKLRTKK